MTKRELKRLLIKLEFTSQFSNGTSWNHKSDTGSVYVTFSRFNKVNSVGFRYVGLTNTFVTGYNTKQEILMEERIDEITESEVLNFLSRNESFKEKIREIKIESLI